VVQVGQFGDDEIHLSATLARSKFLNILGYATFFGISALTAMSRDTAPFGLGLPPASAALGHLRNRVLKWAFTHLLFRDVNAYYDRMRARVGLPPSRRGLLDDALVADLYLQGTTPAFEYPRTDLPPQVHFIGPFVPEPGRDFVPPAWWDELLAHRRPAVHVTQGTQQTDPEQLLIPTLRALAEEDVLVLATTGGKPAESVRLDPLPANVRLERFIPHAHLLPHVDAMVTNGGYGGVQTALGHGVPLVAAGRTEEKPEVCARGVGEGRDRPEDATSVAGAGTCGGAGGAHGSALPAQRRAGGRRLPPP
jgi:UDP:flavonoid glycosyltransferase YjiC (YdhE family)